MYANSTYNDHLVFNTSAAMPTDGGSEVDHQVALYQSMLANISDWQWAIIKDYEFVGQKCMLDFWFSPPPEGVYCNATWDGYSCWPATPANSTVFQKCPNASNDSDAVAHRTCLANGEWLHGPWTNYNLCLVNIIYGLIDPEDRFFPYFPYNEEDDIDNYWKAVILRDIYFYGSIISFILLTLTLLIFTYFKLPMTSGLERMRLVRSRGDISRTGSGYLPPRTPRRSLQCNRISIHKNLVFSFIIRCVIFIVFFEPFVTGREYSYREIDWLCKLLTSILYYSLVANIFWMFVEGLFLHNRVAVSVFNTEAPFRIFYIIGWGSPALIVLAWAICMHEYNPRRCWTEAYELHYMWIIIVPVFIALIVNTVFLVNIIRILITKLRANNTVELDQVRKAVKATVILFPLLGMAHILLFFKPHQLGEAWEMAYRVTHAIFQASQGILVSVIYCFMNSEVRIAIMKKWRRYKSARMDKKGDRRRSSGLGRTSTCLLPLNGNTDRATLSRLSDVQSTTV